MRLSEFALLASDTARTKAYLQAMIRADMLPNCCVLYTEDFPKMKSEAETYEENGEEKYFDVKQPVLFSLQKAEIPYVVVANKDINSEEMKEVLQGLDVTYLIYSGYGGYILKPHLFHMGKKFLHVHAGILPQYRGSTTAYYSILQENKMGATAIFLNEGIDEGEIVTQETFELPKEKVDIDYIYEPYTRSMVLCKVLSQYIKNRGLDSERQDLNGAETYFIIHPALKHLALMKMEANIEKQKECEKK
jgi:methionyl-tRNA formyltransferase